VPLVLKSGSLNLLESSGPVQACNGIALLFYPRRLMPILREEIALSKCFTNCKHSQRSINTKTVLLRHEIYLLSLTYSLPKYSKRVHNGPPETELVAYGHRVFKWVTLLLVLGRSGMQSLARRMSTLKIFMVHHNVSAYTKGRYLKLGQDRFLL
jgi:hypothetical protein